MVLAFRSDDSASSATTTTTKQLVDRDPGCAHQHRLGRGHGRRGPDRRPQLLVGGHGHRGQRQGRRHGDRRPGARDHRLRAACSRRCRAAAVDARQRPGQALRRPGVGRVERPDRRRPDERRRPRTTRSRTRRQALAGASLVATFDGTVSRGRTSPSASSCRAAGPAARRRPGSAQRLGPVVVDRSAAAAPAGSARNIELDSSSSSSTAQIQVVSKGQYTVSPAGRAAATSRLDQGRRDRHADGDDRLELRRRLRRPSAVLRWRFGAASAGPAGTAGTAGTAAGPARAPAAPATATAPGGTGAAPRPARPRPARSPQVSRSRPRARASPSTRSRSRSPPTTAQFSVGSTVTGAIDTVDADNVLQVPIRAVTTSSDGKSTVTVALDGKADGRTATAHGQTGAPPAA